MIKVLFFGRLRELLNCSEIQIDDFELGSVANLRVLLAKKGPKWAEFIEGNNALVAVNQDMVDESSQIKTGDEVAFFPPVTGG
ncbi:molybdopterin converting factor subunit 1 [Pseudoalteromonas denitrificans]|jgi:molybdopterin synthase sulfur carrier subunit|uniref:Molybdopterin synthase sulfur carrier subunit n=1 Tax=Pseudoalteromonas denitrificans DSM 6059 TaxID=1123010 RepID=A0A1I1GZ36_9GAMM|nr:molybdopterin converting factor subunit 1 [Pseudoalteromonas denitrificans]SFC16766.1 molybdopterin synthase sulfur carrier subunit [Pseudoalteromonas denitrificans DSM 6059]